MNGPSVPLGDAVGLGLTISCGRLTLSLIGHHRSSAPEAHSVFRTLVFHTHSFATVFNFDVGWGGDRETACRRPTGSPVTSLARNYQPLPGSFLRYRWISQDSSRRKRSCFSVTMSNMPSPRAQDVTCL